MRFLLYLFALPPLVARVAKGTAAWCATSQPYVFDGTAVERQDRTSGIFAMGARGGREGLFGCAVAA